MEKELLATLKRKKDLLVQIQENASLGFYNDEYNKLTALTDELKSLPLTNEEEIFVKDIVFYATELTKYKKEVYNVAIQNREHPDAKADYPTHIIIGEEKWDWTKVKDELLKATNSLSTIVDNSLSQQEPPAPKKPNIAKPEEVKKMESLKYTSKVSPVLYPYLKQKTKLNPDNIEAKFTTLVNNDQYLNFNTESSKEIISLHEKYLELLDPAIAAKRKLTGARRAHTIASGKVAKSPNDKNALNQQQEAAKTLVERKDDFLARANDVIDIVSALNAELNKFIENYNAANPDNPFVVEQGLEQIKPILKVNEPALSLVSPSTELMELISGPALLDDKVNIDGEEHKIVSQKSEISVEKTKTNVTQEISAQSDDSEKDDSEINPDDEINNFGESAISPEPNPIVEEVEDKKPDNKQKDENKEQKEQDSQSYSSNPPPQNDKPKEEKKSDPKEVALFSASIGFLIGAIATGLLIAGVGVGTALWPILIVFAFVGGLVSLTGGIAGTFKYDDSKSSSKQKTKTAKATKQKDKDKDKSKRNWTIFKRRKQKDTTTENTNLAEGLEIEPYVPQRERAKAEEIKFQQENNLANKENVISASSQGKEIQLLRAALTEAFAKNNFGKENSFENLSNISSIISNNIPENLDISQIADNDREFVQNCINFQTSYLSYRESKEELDNVEAQYQKAIEEQIKSPNKRKLTENAENLGNHAIYESNITEQLFKKVSECYDTLVASTVRHVSEIKEENIENKEVLEEKKEEPVDKKGTQVTQINGEPKKPTETHAKPYDIINTLFVQCESFASTTDNKANQEKLIENIAKASKLIKLTPNATEKEIEISKTCDCVVELYGSTDIDKKQLFGQTFMKFLNEAKDYLNSQEKDQGHDK